MPPGLLVVSSLSSLVSVGCFEEDEVIAIVDVHDELLESGVAEEAVHSAESRQILRVHAGYRESQASEVSREAACF